MTTRLCLFHFLFSSFLDRCQVRWYEAPRLERLAHSHTRAFISNDPLDGARSRLTPFPRARPGPTLCGLVKYAHFWSCIIFGPNCANQVAAEMLAKGQINYFINCCVPASHESIIVSGCCYSGEIIRCPLKLFFEESFRLNFRVDDRV